MSNVKTATVGRPAALGLLAAGVLLAMMAFAVWPGPAVYGASQAGFNENHPTCVDGRWSISSETNYWVETGDLSCIDRNGIWVFAQEAELNHPLYYETCDGNWERQTAASDNPNIAVGDLVCTGRYGYTVHAAENGDDLTRYPPLAPSP